MKYGRDVAILDYRDGQVIFVTIPQDIEDVEEYLTEYHNFHSDCYYMASASHTSGLCIIDNRQENK